MPQPRIIPLLLLHGTGFFKTQRFKDPTYLGDPLNILKIFNEKEVDEIAIVDIDATPAGRPPDFSRLSDMASECFMPLAYGGGVTTVAEIKELFRTGFEKVILNSVTYTRPELVTEAARIFGSQSVVVSIDARKKFFGKYEAVASGGRVKTGREPAAWAAEMVRRGAGEIMINAVERDGTMQGYDHTLIRQVTSAVGVPVIACGGASGVADFSTAFRESGAAACAAGALFVFHGRHRAVLINVPSPAVLRAALAPS
jgi:cyclase